MSYPGQLFGEVVGSYLSAEKQSVYSTALVNWVIYSGVDLSNYQC